MHNQKHTEESKKLISLKTKESFNRPEVKEKLIKNWNNMKGKPAKNKGIWLNKICPICNTKFEYPKYLNSIYCSKKCASESRKGKKVNIQNWNPLVKEKNGMWKGGVRRTYNTEARKIMENSGININGKDVHHIDGNWKNNKIENLKVLTRGEHIRLHRLKDGLRPHRLYKIDD